MNTTPTRQTRYYRDMAIGDTVPPRAAGGGPTYINGRPPWVRNLFLEFSIEPSHNIKKQNTPDNQRTS